MRTLPCVPGWGGAPDTAGLGGGLGGLPLSLCLSLFFIF